ncbi:MAG TPA: methyltransferase domain-containing protein [Trichocoleus sp.]
MANQWLQGQGLEVGALHNPLMVPPTAHVAYVDRMDVASLRQHYPELATVALVPVDVVDNGETLETFAADSQDFLIGNHFLEHCQDPIGTLKNWLRVLKPGGVIYMAVPNKHQSFDRNRSETSWDHLVQDHQDSGKGSRADHYFEWVTLVDPQPVAHQAAAQQHLMAQDYSIHFHVWTPHSLEVFLSRCITELHLPYEICAFEKNGSEIIAILRKRVP